jgi:plasmid maintenance system killer protein
MQKFKGDKIRQIYETRFAVGVPQHVCVAAHATVHPLLAARDLQDIGVLGQIIRLRNNTDRYGLHINGKWHVTFAWSDDYGAFEVAIERR